MSSTLSDGRPMPTPDTLTEPPATAAGTATGQPVDRYELLEQLGRGGMGVVHRGRDRVLNRPVAVKFAHPGSDPARFLREAQLLAAVRSPGVVPVHDFALLPDGRSMLVMGWIDGHDLGRELKDRDGSPLDEPTARRWMSDVAAGMLAAEQRQIVHRDLKPSNVLIDKATGGAVVTDFGLARSPTVDHLTATGGVMGTPHYMAPEQAEDPRAVDTRADIYSFGAMFYHALTGRPPFDGPSHFSVLYKHKTEPLVAPRAINPGLSERTTQLIERCLAKTPANRFESFREVLTALRSGGQAPWERDDPLLNHAVGRYQPRRALYLSGRTDDLRTPDVYSFPDGRTLRVEFGDLTRQADVEALVSSDTNMLGMNYGVSLAFRRATGDAFADAVGCFAPVSPGRAVVTSAGSLPARFIFHVAVIGYDRDRAFYPSRDLIAELIDSCFYHADTLGVRTIAFPLLASGGAGLSPDVSLDTMFLGIARKLLTGLTTVSEARIVLYAPDLARRPGGPAPTWVGKSPHWV